jgi:hypothetical protein
MQIYKAALTFILLCLILVACQPAPQETLPTLAASPEAEQVEATTEITAEASLEPTRIPPTVARERPTLPPTWTPAATATTVPTATHTPTPVLPPTPLEVCNTFGEDTTKNTRTYVFGEPATVYWTGVEGAASYYVRLINAENETVFEDYTIQPSYTFKADLFEEGLLYGWEVYPLDPLNQQMCTSRGVELFPAPPQ